LRAQHRDIERVQPVSHLEPNWPAPSARRKWAGRSRRRSWK
jgi:hypothetical protein